MQSRVDNNMFTLILSTGGKDKVKIPTSIQKGGYNYNHGWVSLVNKNHWTLYAL